MAWGGKATGAAARPRENVSPALDELANDQSGPTQRGLHAERQKLSVAAESTVQIADMLSQPQIDELISELDHSEGTGTGSYWQMLKHVEKNGFNLASMKRALHRTLTSELDEALRPKDDASERDLILALRDRMRLEMLMPPLSAEERSNWQWQEPSRLRRYRYTGPPVLNDQPRLTTDHIDAVIAYIRKAHPEVARYLRAVKSHNEPLGHNGGPNDHYIVREAWHEAFVEDAICEIIGEKGDVWVERYRVELAIVRLLR